MAMSSAKLKTFLYIINNEGPGTDPCWTSVE